MAKLSPEAKAHKHEYNKKYHRENFVRFTVTYHKNKETEIINKLQTVPNKSQYIKELVLEDLAKEKD